MIAIKDEHAPLPPSGSRKWAWCPGSPALEKKVLEKAPELGADSPASLKGTGFHTFIDEVIKTRVSPIQLMGKIYNEHFTVDEVAVTHAHRLLDIISDLLEEYRDPLALVITEIKVYPGKLFGRDDCWGTADIVIFFPSTKSIIVIDIKYGVVLVEVGGNPQLLLYLLGIMEHFNLFGEGIGTLRTGVYQPRSKKGDAKEPLRWQEYSIEEIAEWIEYFRVQAQKTDYSRPEYVPSEETCQWCKARHVCDAYATSVFSESLGDPEILKNSVDGFDIAKEFNSLGEGLTDADALTLGKLLNSKPAALAFYKDVEKHALAMAKTGTKIPMFKLVYTQPRRKWLGDQDKIIRQLRGWKLLKKDITEVKLRPLTQMEALVKKTGNEAHLETLKKDLIVTPEKQLILVSGSDDREEVDNHEDMFRKAIAD